jgi:hypothetical protein
MLALENSDNGLAILEKFLIKGRQYPVNPRNVFKFLQSFWYNSFKSISVCRYSIFAPYMENILQIMEKKDILEHFQFQSM